MKIVIDVQGCQSKGSRERGIGRYSLSLIKALVKNYPEIDFILFANPALFDLRSIFADELASNNINVSYFQWIAPGPFNDHFVGDDSCYFNAVQLRSYALEKLDADICLVTSFFEGFTDNCVIKFDHTYKLPPIISIFYDIIPLLNKETYLKTNPDFERFYLKQIEYLKTISSVLCISESAANEARSLFNNTSPRVFNISSGCDEVIFNSESNLTNEISFDLASLGDFILYSGAGDPRKNLLNLIRAYANLPPNYIVKHKLVLAGKLIKPEIENILELMNRLNLPTDYVVLLGFVSDNELVSLYRKCYLFIFPSLHEGFGLPVLEAMNCGAPVIVSNCTSLPEVVELKEALFDPLNIDSIKDLIIKCIDDLKFYNKLKSNSKERCKLFSWDITAKNTKNAIEEITKELENVSKNSISRENLSSFDRLILNLNRNNMQYKQYDSKEYYFKLLASSINIIDDQISSRIDKRCIFSSSQSSWLMEGPFDSSYSLSILNREFALSMINKVDNFSINSSEGDGDYPPDFEFLSKYPTLYKLYKNSLNKNNLTAITSRNMYPPRVNDMKSSINLMHCYGWEESEFPRVWVENFNRYLDGMTVMSKQVKKIMIDNGVSIPIQVSGLGVDHVNKSLMILNKINEAKSFCFLHISSCFPRKGISILLKAFENCFTINDDVSLIIKTFINPHNDLDNILASFRENNKNFPHVLVVYDDLSDDQIYSLYKQSDCLVAPSFGEGFGLPLAEAMYLKLPVITTGWGGQTDFCSDQTSWLVDYKFSYAETHFQLISSIWAEPSVDHLGTQMLKVYSLNEDQIRAKTDLAHKKILSYTWDSVAKININSANHISNSKYISIPRIGVMTTYNSACGIANYAQSLFLPNQDYYTIFAPYDEEILNTDSDNVYRCWDLHGSNFDKLFVEIITQKITTLVINFNFGLYDFDKLSNFLSRLFEKDINVLIIFHSTIEPFDRIEKKLENLSHILKKCTRLLVHTPDDMNRLKDRGLIDNVTLFPHGIIDYEPKIRRRNFNRETLYISTSGFCLPDKGFLELIEAISLVLKKGIKVHLTMLTSIHSSSISSDFSNLLKRRIKELSLDVYISTNFEYIPIENILDELSISDIAIYPYQKSNEASSAAVRNGISSLTNVLVTPLPVFNDVLKYVDVLPGKTAEDIANWLCKNYSRIISSRSEKDNNLENKLIWKKESSFTNVGFRLQNMIRSLELNKNFYELNI
tara:strand:- start:14355 stop:18014 length:3660 start_codon:yes stop_codon:yes gene_type:complete